MKCSLPACDSEALVQWQRQPREGETREPTVEALELQELMFEQRRYTQRIAIRELEAMRADPDTNPRVHPNLDRQIAAGKDLLDALVFVPVPVPDRQTTVAVYACKDHTIQRDEATRLHESGCLQSGLCVCVTGESPLVQQMDPEYAAVMSGAAEPADWFKD